MVGAQQVLKAVGTLLKLIAYAQYPSRGMAFCIPQRAHLQAVWIGPAYEHCGGGIKTERGEPPKSKPCLVFPAHPHQQLSSVVGRRQIQDCCCAGSQILRVKIDVAVDDGQMSQQRPTEVQLALYPVAQSALQMLRRDFAEQDLLHEIFRADGNRRWLVGATADQGCED